MIQPRTPSVSTYKGRSVFPRASAANLWHRRVLEVRQPLLMRPLFSDGATSSGIPEATFLP